MHVILRTVPIQNQSGDLSTWVGKCISKIQLFFNLTSKMFFISCIPLVYMK